MIDVEHGITPPAPPPGNVRYVAVRNLAGVQAGAGCDVDNPTTPTIAACEGVFAAVVVFGNGGNDKVTDGPHRQRPAAERRGVRGSRATTS